MHQCHNWQESHVYFLNACMVQALQPNEGEVEELRGHVVIAGFGRVGQIIAQLLSERLIPFVALDVRSDRVQVLQNRPIFFVEMSTNPSTIAFMWCRLYFSDSQPLHALNPSLSDLLDSVEWWS